MNHVMSDDDFEYFIQSRGEGRHVCPLCSGDRKKKNQKTLDVDEVADGLVYKWWHCEASGIVRRDDPFDDFEIDKPVTKVTAISVPKQSDQLVADNFLTLRGIDPSRVRHLNVVGGNHYFHNVGDVPAIGFAYKDKSAIKWRSTEGKNFIQDGSAQNLWNIESATDEHTTVIITEGELDCCAISDALGSRTDHLVVSVPSGAPQKVSNRKVDPEEERKFGYLWKAKSVLDRAEKIILAMDADEPGEALGEEIMRRVGRAKCYHLELPEGCKDANDALREHGADYLAELIDCAVPTPLVGVYSADDYG